MIFRAFPGGFRAVREVKCRRVRPLRRIAGNGFRDFDETGPPRAIPGPLNPSPPAKTKVLNGFPGPFTPRLGTCPRNAARLQARAGRRELIFAVEFARAKIGPKNRKTPNFGLPRGVPPRGRPSPQNTRLLMSFPSKFEFQNQLLEG